VASRVRSIGNGEELSETLYLPMEVALWCSFAARPSEVNTIFQRAVRKPMGLSVAYRAAI